MCAESDRKQVSSLVRTDGVTSVVKSADSSLCFIWGSVIDNLNLERRPKMGCVGCEQPISRSRFIFQNSRKRLLHRSYIQKIKQNVRKLT
jgi:hypothetical protein